MKQVSYNSIANIFGKIWITVASIVCIPFYAKALGAESFGLVGIYMTSFTLLNLLDVGFSTALSRDLARSSLSQEDSNRTKILARTIEFLYFLITLLIIIISVFIFPLVGIHWFKTEALNEAELSISIVMLGLALAARFPSLMYYSGLQGLQKNVSLNVVQISTETLRVLACSGTLFLFYPTPKAFFVCQLIVNLIQTLTLRSIFWRSFHFKYTPPLLDFNLLNTFWKLSGPMALFSISGISLVQIDKLILIGTCTLKEFGYYSIATTIGYVPHYLVMTPIYLAIYPYLSLLVARNDEKNLARQYHFISQISCIAVVPVGLIIAFFSNEILLIWTQDITITERTQTVVSLFAIFTTIHSLIHVPYALQLAYGKVSLPIKINVIMFITSIPLIFFLANFFGILSGAINWGIINVTYFIVMVAKMHEKILKGEMLDWYIKDTIIPTFFMVSICATFKFLMPKSLNTELILLWISFTYVGTCLAGSLSITNIRHKLIDQLRLIVLR